MRNSIRDKAFFTDCIMAGGDIRELAEWAVDAGFSLRKFRVFCEFMLIKES